MKKSNLTIAVILIFCFKLSFGQKKNYGIQKKGNPFEMVHVDDSVRNKLNNFIWEKEQDSTEIGVGMHIYHILLKDKANNYKFVEGIYRFKLIGTHSNLYYFIYTKKDGIQIIRDYSVENILTQVLEYFKKSEPSLNDIEKLDYLGSIIKDLKYNNEISKPGFYGDYEIFKKPAKP